MASPAATGGAGLGLTAIGGIVQGLGAKEAADANAAAYTYKAGVAQLNKQVNDQNAAWALQAGGIQGEEQGLKAGEEIGATKAVQSSSGFDVNSGSNAAVRKTQTSVSQFNEGVISWDAAKASYGYEVKAATDTAEANLDTMAASQSKIAGNISMISSFLNAGGSVASKWSQGQTSGMFPT